MRAARTRRALSFSSSGAAPASDANASAVEDMGVLSLKPIAATRRLVYQRGDASGQMYPRRCGLPAMAVLLLVHPVPRLRIAPGRQPGSARLRSDAHRST